MEVITITLDGIDVSGHPGSTILDLARESGVDIPTLCHDPHLTPIGACRLCLVEDETSGALLASCVSPIRAGMVINTRSTRVIERRKTIMQFILASHPDSCLICDKGNHCQLRQLASEMGIGMVELQRIPQPGVIEEINPFIERDLSKCILCAKCIRADHELVVEGAIDYMNRGFNAKPATLGDQPLENSECTFCGTCVALCPTGALMEKEKSYHGTVTTTVDTICPFCGCGCGISLEIKDNHLVRVRPNNESPVNHGTLCVRGCYGYDFVHSPERLTSPLIKVDGDLQEASWNEALGKVATELNQIKEEHGPDSLAVLGSSKCTNEENYLLQRLARGILGTNNIDNGSRLYSAAGRYGLGWSIGFPGTTNSIDVLENSEAIMVIGANPSASAPAVAYAIKRAVKYKGVKLLLIDPRETKLVPFADYWLRPRIGTDILLLNLFARVIIDEKLLDEEFVSRRTDNYEALVDSLKPYTTEHVEEMTGISGREVEQAARVFAEAQRASIIFGNGINQQANGTDSVKALANLMMLTGNAGQRGGGIFALQRENNARGACDMGSLPDFLPGYQRLDDSQVISGFAERWGASLPTDYGLNALEMIKQSVTGKIRAMLIMGENPVASFPQSSLVKKALNSLDLLVVTDMFLTETARSANVILPAASFAEKEGTFTNFEGRVQRVYKSIKPIGNSLPDWEIILRLASSMGHPMPYSSPQQVMDEIERLVPLYQHPSDNDLKTEESSPIDYERGELKTRRFYTGLFPSGFHRFSPANNNHPMSIHQDDYPLMLITGSILNHFGNGTRSLMSWRLKRFSPDSWVEISDDDVRQLGYRDQDMVKVISPMGEIKTTIKISRTLPSGTLFMPISFPASPVNELFDISPDSEGRSYAPKICAVRLERIDPDG